MKRVKVEVEEKVSDAEARQLMCEMHAYALEMVNSKLPGMVKRLVRQKTEWMEFKKKNGGDFTSGSLLTVLVRANGKRPSLLYDERVKAILVERHARFCKVFPTFEVLRFRMSKLKLEWPEWWQ